MTTDAWPGPRAAARASATKMDGIANIASTVREITVSTRPRR